MFRVKRRQRPQKKRAHSTKGRENSEALNLIILVLRPKQVTCFKSIGAFTLQSSVSWKQNSIGNLSRTTNQRCKALLTFTFFCQKPKQQSLNWTQQSWWYRWRSQPGLFNHHLCPKILVKVITMWFSWSWSLSLSCLLPSWCIFLLQWCQLPVSLLMSFLLSLFILVLLLVLLLLWLLLFLLHFTIADFVSHVRPSPQHWEHLPSVHHLAKSTGYGFIFW